MIKGDRILNVGTPAGGGISIIANDPVTSGGGGGGDATDADDSLIIADASAYIATTEEIRVIAESGVSGKIVARELL